MKNGTEKITVNGIVFKIGYRIEAEFSGYVCEMEKDNKKLGVFLTNEDNREMGWRTDIYATDEELEAIKEAKRIMRERYGRRSHG